MSVCIGLCLLCFHSFAQQTVKAVKADEEINQVFTIKDLYTYPQFMPGKVFMRDGTVVEAALNYHRLFEQVMYISSKDTLAIGNPEMIKVIVIGKDSFYYNKGSYYELVATYKSIELALRQTLLEIDQEKTGLYGQRYTNNSTVANKNNYTVDGQPHLNVGESTLFSQKVEYFVSYRYADFVPATKKNIEKLFSDKSKEVKEYIKNNSIDFTKEEDLKKLLGYIQSL
jgi:hypothetical protein